MEEKKKITTVAEVIKQLKKFDQKAQFFVSNDEELNAVHWGFEISGLGDTSKVVIYPLSGQEQEFEVG